MSNLEMMMRMENETCNGSEYVKVFQELIDKGMIASFGMWHQETAKILIDSGICKENSAS